MLEKDFIARHAGRMGFPQTTVAADALTALQEMEWPGNVRQLENMVCELILLARGLTINRSHV